AESHKGQRQATSEGSSAVSLADGGPHSVQVWCPKGQKRFPRDVTELDVVLTEFEKITANYKQSVELKICRKAINGFYSGFRDQLTNTMAEVQKLKSLKRENTKLATAINKKRRRLMEVKEELIR
uniref:Centromere protein U n=2 Tax=Sphenodon punctatus TaxID=8508 RepID=A0A8D0HH59_SPHPU